MSKTVIVNPSENSSGSGIGFFMGIVLLIAFVLILIYFGLPYVRNLTQNTGPQINVPEQIDVNVNQNP